MSYWIEVLRPWLRARLRPQAPSERGAILVEYALLVGLVALVCIIAISIIGVRANGMLTSLQVPG